MPAMVTVFEMALASLGGAAQLGFFVHSPTTQVSQSQYKALAVLGIFAIIVSECSFENAHNGDSVFYLPWLPWIVGHIYDCFCSLLQNPKKPKQAKMLPPSMAFLQ